MRSYRRMTALVALITVLMLVAAACGSTEGEVDESGGAQAGGDSGELTTINEGRLTVGSDIPWPPFEYRKGGALIGFDIDLIKEIGDRLGLEITDEDIRDTSFDTIFTQLAGGQYDVIVAASTITAEREKQINFSEPYYNSQQSLTVESGADLTSVDDLSEGMVVGVQNGTTGKAWAEENVPEGVEIRSFKQGPDGFTALEAGQVDGVINDEPTALAEIEQRGGQTLELVETIDTGETYGIGVNPQNQALLDAVNQTLNEIIQDGTYKEIYDRYPDLPPGGSVVDEGN
jgi:ABC-type amino acid transport substrate-binding protein